ncbi:MAG: glycosyltransferase family 4 protein [Fuerstiella sp.]
MPRVAFVTSHPIQYQVPVFRHLAQRTDLDFQVLFAMLPDAAAQGAGFGVHFEWDLPLLEGYEYSVLNNVSADPGVTHFGGCNTPGIHDELRRRKIDVVIVNGWVVKTCLQALQACRRLGIPCIVRGEANNLRPRPWWKRMLQRQLVRRYDACLPIGNASREFYRSHGVSDDRMFDARYCIDNDRFEKAAAVAADQAAAIRERWRIPDGVLCFLYCGKFETKKHPVELTDAVRHAVKHGARLHLLMVGDGPLKAECEALAEQGSLPVTFTGFLNQTEIVEAYVAADLLALPSDHGETWGLVVNEGMVCGLPAVVSDQVGCASDLIVEDKTGWVFPFGDWDRLAELMSELAGRPEDVRQMGPACRALVRRYSPSAAAEGMAAAVRAVSGEPGESNGG